MTPEQAAELRKPFADDVIGKLPRVFCRACKDAPRNLGACGNNGHRRVKCNACGNNITTAHLHLDYVGHAEATDRLLAVDSAWSWEPVAFGQDGLPSIDRAGGLWIRLTVAGVTRLGYGHAEGKTGPDAVKEAIGDAIRNAAMRFGVALDLWGAKFKPDQEEHGAEPASGEEWEQAEAVPNDVQAERFTEFERRIKAADTPEKVQNLGQLVKDARGTERITRAQYDQLARIAGARLAELQVEPA